jgi:hypothetical protein
MFDYYAMPESWPGRAESKTLHWQQRASCVETAILQDITATLGNNFNPEQLIPYVQLHEFEALVFSEVKTMAAVVAPLHSSNSEKALIQKFQAILDEKGFPEAINDSYSTCPSRRIQAIVNGYRKRSNGPIITQKIGLPTLRERCQHFAEWVLKLEALNGQ